MVKKKKVEIPVEEIVEPTVEVEPEEMPTKAKYYEELFRGGK